MAYEVTATRRRPRVFDELSGQEFVVSTLKHAIRQKRIAHAYLFSGPRGVGKTSAARVLAKALNCDDGPTDTPCGVCPHCREITSGNALDVIEIDGASNTSVNDVRRIKDEVLFSPNSGRYKIYIIDEVHMLSNSAFNALLKTIEEPPAYVIFIFATTEVHKVPATIRSRCQQFHFQLIALDTIRDLLAEAADEQCVTMDDEVMFWIARESTGSLRDAYTLFDQVVSLAAPEGTAVAVTMDLIRQNMGLTSINSMNLLAETVAKGDAAEAIITLQEILASGVSVEQCIVDLTEYYRAILFIESGITKDSLLGSQIDHYSREVIRSYTQEQIEAAVSLMLQLYRDIRYSLNQRFELELAVSRLCRLKGLVSSSTLVGRLETLQRQLLGEAGSGAAAPVARPAVPQHVPRSEVRTEIRSDIPPDNRAEIPPEKKRTVPEQEVVIKGTITITRSHIETVQASLKSEQPALAAVLGHVVDWKYDQEADQLFLVFPDAFTASRVSAEKNLLTSAFSTLLRRQLSIRISTKAPATTVGPPPGGQTPPPVSSKSEGVTRYRHDSTVEMARALFRGDIISEKQGGTTK